MTREELENRLIDFSVGIIQISRLIEKTRGGSVISGQVVRCGTSPALNYGEAQSAESKKDFIHKLQVVLKELRETMICLKIIQKSQMIRKTEILDDSIKENNELMAIFVKSIQTARNKK